MITEIKMPQLGQTTDEVRLIKWLVKEGDAVKMGQPLCEVETDKVTMEMESYARGKVIKLISPPDSIVKTDEVIAIIGDPKDNNAKDLKVDTEVKNGLKVLSIDENTTKEDKSSSRDKQVSKNKGEIKATNLVKNLAKVKKIDLSDVKGTGPRGLITKSDLENYEKASKEEKIIELTPNQVAVARNLLKSKTEVPHYYLTREICVERFLKWKKLNKDTEDSKVSMYSIMVYATAKALNQMPVLNGYFKDCKIIMRKDINIGFALSVGNELYVPVVKNADLKKILEIDIEIKKLVSKAEQNNLVAGDISGGTFTITNLGMFDVNEFLAIINGTQSGIFSIGKIRKIPYVDKNEKISIKNIFSLTASFDHRFVNGKLGAEFMGIFGKIFEEELPLE
jgi:pyruvate dehydrogenase E2 component (dihydrolipoamide acetyltransferase)